MRKELGIGGLANRQEISRLERGTADQSAIDVFHGKQFCGITRVHAASVENPYPGGHIAVECGQFAADKGMAGQLRG